MFFTSASVFVALLGILPLAWFFSKSQKTDEKKVIDLKSAPQTHQSIKSVGWLYPTLSAALMVVGPLGIYWAWACLEFNQGKLILPSEMSVKGVQSWFFEEILEKIYTHAIPGEKAFTIYMSWLLFQGVLYVYAPGPIGKGALLEDGKTRLSYKYNGQFAWFTTLLTAIVLHATGLFPLTELYDYYPQLLTMCNLVTSVVTGLLLVYAKVANCGERMTDSVVYDYFMGAILNPRIGNQDIKFFFELRPGIMHWYLTTLAMAAKQYQTYSTISTPMALVCFFHLCFVNACYKGEQCVPMSMDIIYEKFGWMLCWLDLVVVPFIFPMSALYLYKVGPFEHSLPFTLLVALMHVVGYWIFDTANSQKDYFREKPEEEIPKGFPRLPWDKIAAPKFITTKRGTKLLTSGWWGLARHINYTGDLLMAWSWGFICGFDSFFPYVYAVCYLTPLLLHRERRDHYECQKKYGKDWDIYCSQVPHRLVPYLY
eukprot:Sdes_comp20531_c0_seq1m15193